MRIVRTKVIDIKGSQVSCVLVAFSDTEAYWYQMGKGNSAYGLTLKRITAKRELVKLCSTK